MKNKLIEGEDFYYTEQGFIVLTAKYHLERGSCCGNSCRHCPYEYINVQQPEHKDYISTIAPVKKNDQ